MPGFEFFGEEERKEVNEVLETGILMRYGFDAARKGRWKAKELEQEINKTFGSKYAQLTSSGTSALTTALSVLGIGYGDEVIMPCFTFVASFEAVLGVGAVPVLVDIDKTLTLNPAAVKAAITPRTKCIMPVHMCGRLIPYILVRPHPSLPASLSYHVFHCASLRCRTTFWGNP